MGVPPQEQADSSFRDDTRSRSSVGVLARLHFVLREILLVGISVELRCEAGYHKCGQIIFVETAKQVIEQLLRG